MAASLISRAVLSVEISRHPAVRVMSRASLSKLSADLGRVTLAGMNAGRTARERARAELTQEIKDEARRQLASSGADALSLRAVARELGMVSSALYRYFPSRDDLLTALIMDAYHAWRTRRNRPRRRSTAPTCADVGSRAVTRSARGRANTRTSTR